MREYLPLIIPCAIIGVFTLVFLCAYAVLKKKTAKETSERHMPDSEIIRRLLRYAAPYKKEFALIFFIMLVSIAYDVVSPLLVATIQGTIKLSFQLSRLFTPGGRLCGHSGCEHGLHLLPGYDPPKDRPKNPDPAAHGYLYPH